MAGKATTCCFCGVQCHDLAMLKTHSGACVAHPLFADAMRGRKLMDLAAYGGTYKGEHVWRFRPIMGPHKNLLDAVDHMGE